MGLLLFATGCTKETFVTQQGATVATAYAEIPFNKFQENVEYVNGQPRTTFYASCNDVDLDERLINTSFAVVYYCHANGSDVPLPSIETASDRYSECRFLMRYDIQQGAAMFYLDLIDGDRDDFVRMMYNNTLVYKICAMK